MASVTPRDRFGLVTIEGVDYAIVDIGMRMLQPRELYRAQGFPDTYKIEVPYPYTRRAPRRKAKAQGRVAAFLSNKGGVGKSTLAVNVACALALRHPDEVLLIDTTRSRKLGIGQHRRKNDRIDAEVMARAVES